MNKSLMASFLSAVLITTAQSSESTRNYVVTINGQNFELNPGETIKSKTKTGAAISIALKRKEFTTFENGPLKFEYRSDLSVASTDVDSDIHQHLVASALGTLLIVQQYDKLNPATLTDFMLKQMTDDDVAASAKLQSKPFSIKLSDGTLMKGLKASIKSAKDDVTMEVLAADTGIGGVMAISRINTDMAKNEQPIIDRFWKTLRVKK
jgi:hypothetical protein